MGGWGNNPETVEAAATALTVVAVAFAWLSLRESKTQRRAAELEVAARMRPWVGLFGLGFDPLRSGEVRLQILMRNFGPIPAQQARLKLVIEPRGKSSDERANPVVWQEQIPKALMPAEEGNYSIDLSAYPQMRHWIDAARDITVNGLFEYGLNEKRFESTFGATLWFSRCAVGNAAVETNWRNDAAT